MGEGAVGALLERPSTLLLLLLLLAVAAVVIVVVVVAKSGRGSPAPQAQPMTLYNGRWLRWDGARWLDAETGAPIVDPIPPAE